MHSRSGWPPVFNALFVGASVMLLVVTVQPGNLPIQNSFEFLASVAGQPPLDISTLPGQPDLSRTWAHDSGFGLTASDNFVACVHR